MKLGSKILFGLGLLTASVLWALGSQSNPEAITLESQESETMNGGPVFNKIQFFSEDGKDIWMMNQSHHGLHADPLRWDRLAIVVDKKKSPKEVQFFQFEPGELKWLENLPRKDYKVSCFICHSNGPRAIRPNFASLPAPLSWGERLKILKLNFKIKSYGAVTASSEQIQWDQTAKTPFHALGLADNDPLKVRTCVKCHNGEGHFSRGILTRQNIPTIQFMLKQGYMPPLGFSLSVTEKKELGNFLRGF